MPSTWRFQAQLAVRIALAAAAAVSGVARAARGADAADTFCSVTGNPPTPVVASIYNANTDRHRSLYGAIASTRSNAFHRLDERLDERLEKSIPGLPIIPSVGVRGEI